MNKSDKDKLVILLVIVLYIAMTVFFIRGTKKIPWYLIILSLVAIEYLVAQPRLCKLYYQANNQQIGFTRFIPFWNEVAIFEQVDAILALVSYLVLTLVFILFFLPADTVVSLMGEHIALNYGTYVIRAIFICLLINSIIVGIGFLHVTRNIKIMHKTLTHGYANFSTGIITVVFGFLPIIRTLAVMNLMNALTKLVLFNNYHSDDNEVDQLEEELK
jgi:membrane protein